MKPVAICENLLSKHRKNESAIESWENWLNKYNIPWQYVDCYNYDIIEKLPNFSALIWHYSNFVNADLMEAQNILNLASSMGLKTYPNYYTGWHFDDKIAQMYALQAINAPIPKSWVFYRLDECLDFINNNAQYPIVAKLRRGSGANNVHLLKSPREARKYARRMFNRGFHPAPSLAYKFYSKVQSTKDWATLKKRFKQIPNFLWARHFGRQMPAEKGYCYFQEFIQNTGYDLKVAVAGGKCSYFARKTRKGDFRASGGGEFFLNASLMTPQIIESALRVAAALKMQCVGFDYVVDQATGEGKIIEMCHGFDADAIFDCGGYWDAELTWHDRPLNVKIEIIKDLLKDFTQGHLSTTK